MLIGLDGAGKTTLIKRKKELPDDACEYYTTTSLMNIEKIPFA